MKIVDIGICINNMDPRGLGRIRCVRFSEYVSEKERAMEYEPYSAEDPFVANPFLPLNINVVPSEGQSIKIINYDSEKLNVNQEYIAGPFINVIDQNNQTFTQQIENTTYGNTNKTRENVFDEEGSYRNKKSEGFYHKNEDFGIYGKNGSDIVFTNGGIIIRGGKLTNKNRLSSKERVKSMDQPFMYNKVPAIQVKKYPQKLSNSKQIVNVSSNEKKLVKYLIEYSVDNFTNPTKITCQLYRNNLDDEKYYSDVFNVNTNVNNDYLPMIDGGYVKNVDTLKKGIIEINNFIYKIFKGEDLKIIIKNDFMPDFPIYFRPTKNNYDSVDQNKITLFNGVKFFNLGPMSGLIWDKNKISQNNTITQQEKDILIPNNNEEETISSVISDRVYLLSTDTNESDKSVDFTKINNYEVDQETYLKVIEPNTYSMVRGENLITLLKSIIDVLLTHEHNVVGPMVQNENYEKYNELMDHLKSIENDILNKKLKIN